MKPKNRSEYVFKALERVPCRFELCKQATKATRAIHYPGDRVVDTTNKALLMIRTVK